MTFDLEHRLRCESHQFQPKRQEGMESGNLRKDDSWEIVFEMSAPSHGLIMLYLGGRVSAPLTHFRAVYRHSFRRYIRGIRK